MVLNKFDQKSDAIADLYRAALYLARGADTVGLAFLQKARKKLGQKIVEIPSVFKTRQQQKFWAEKILDQYLKLKEQLL